MRCLGASRVRGVSRGLGVSGSRGLLYRCCVCRPPRDRATSRPRNLNSDLDKIASGRGPLASFAFEVKGLFRAGERRFCSRAREGNDLFRYSARQKCFSYLTWQAPCTREGHDETGFDSFETATRVPSHSPASSGLCGPPPKLLDRFWTIIHFASLNPTNWPQRSKPKRCTTTEPKGSVSAFGRYPSIL
jgi:hypothetical protein